MVGFIITFLLAGALLFSYATCYFLLRKFKRKIKQQTPYLKFKDLLLVIAHPDDESMFFLPTCTFDGFETKRLICLSNGDYNGLGKVREKELKTVVMDILGFDSLEIRDFIDGPEETWDLDKISNVIESNVKKNTTIITFDEMGVSHHKNHISAYLGAKRLLERRPGLEIFKLHSDSSVLVKFSSIFGACLSIYYSNVDFDNSFVFVNADVWISFRTMKTHYSQFVWYRRLFIFFARCTYLNVIEKLK